MASTLNVHAVTDVESVVDSPNGKQFMSTTEMTEEVEDEFAGLPSGNMSTQDIAQFFAGRYIFITGATGFVGKVCDLYITI